MPVTEKLVRRFYADLVSSDFGSKNNTVNYADLHPTRNAVTDLHTPLAGDSTRHIPLKLLHKARGFQPHLPYKVIFLKMRDGRVPGVMIYSVVTDRRTKPLRNYHLHLLSIRLSGSASKRFETSIRPLFLPKFPIFQSFVDN